MNIKLTTAALLATFITVSGCVSEFHADIPYADENILVVEGDIVANSEVDIILSKTFSLDNSLLPDNYNDINATVYLVGSDGYKSPAATHVGDGVHRLTVGKLLSDVYYSVEIEYDGNKYASDPEVPLYTPEIDKLDWKQAYEASDVSIRVSTHSDEPGHSYYMWDYIEDWEYSSNFAVYDFYIPETGGFDSYNWAPLYYCWRNRRGKEILLGSTETLTENRILNQQLRAYESVDERFNVLYSIRLKQIAITKRAYEYYQNQAKMSDDMGGLFTPQPSELAGNIKCTSDRTRRVIGYINILKNVTETQMYIKSSDIIKGRIPGCALQTAWEVKKILDEQKISFLDYYYMGNWPLEDDLQKASWTKASCIDCTMRGGTKNKPDWWPNDHK